MAFVLTSGAIPQEIYAFDIHVPSAGQPVLAIGQISWVKPVREIHLAGVKWLLWESEDDKQLAIQAAMASPESRT